MQVRGVEAPEEAAGGFDRTPLHEPDIEAWQFHASLVTKTKEKAMTRKLSDGEVLFAEAYEARQAEIRRALRDPEVWREQLLGIPVTLLKIACFVLLTAVGGRLATDLDRSVLMWVSAFAAVFIVPWNPGHFFWRNAFVGRGDVAFQKVIDKHSI